ncbi:MAG: transglycosylase, partial [Gorillibacterium sp.]|nr:transglycosylase [Gorillibacterium sp.]
VQKDIEKMELDHGRELTKRGLEAVKDALTKEKEQRVADYNNQIATAKEHYDKLQAAFEDFSLDTESQAEAVKNIQILKESEKNAEILKQLDQFILDYKAKAATITSLASSKSQKETDFEEYTKNQNEWNVTNDPARKIALHDRNVALRKQYGIPDDNYLGIQHFSEGGAVQGARGSAVPIVAHAGEIVMNDWQQANILKLMNFSMPALNFSMPSFSVPQSSSSNPVVNNSNFTIKSGDTYIADESVARTFWNEKDSLVRRFQARGGK